MDVHTRAQRSFNMSRIRSKDTKPERVVRRLLHGMGYRFRLHRKDLPGKPDVVLPKYRTVIFVNGCFWHMHECPAGQRHPKTNSEFWTAKRDRTRVRDQEKLMALNTLGWRCLTVWECEIRDVIAVSRYLETNLRRSILQPQGNK